MAVHSLKTWQKIKNNPQLLNQYFLREKVTDGIRGFFKARNFHEVETPLLVERPSTETYLEFFETELSLADGTRKRGFLTTSPEYAMKKLLAAGVGDIFQICKSFRNNEGRSGNHNSEFTILEWYRTNANYTDIMMDCEELFLGLWALTQKDQSLEKEHEKKPATISVTPTLKYQGREFNLARPWLRISVAEAFEQWAHVSKDALVDEKKLIEIGKQKGYYHSNETNWEEVYNQIFLNEIEPQLAKLSQPVFLYDYPTPQAALSRRKASDPRFAERFELYIGGIELGNAFSELTDADEQEKRLRADLALRPKLGKKTYDLDEDFINALKNGMPQTGGIAVGVDRLIMLLADVPSIHETQFFPYFDVFDV